MRLCCCENRTSDVDDGGVVIDVKSSRKSGEKRGQIFATKSCSSSNATPGKRRPTTKINSKTPSLCDGGTCLGNYGFMKVARKERVLARVRRHHITWDRHGLSLLSLHSLRAIEREREVCTAVSVEKGT